MHISFGQVRTTNWAHFVCTSNERINELSNKYTETKKCEEQLSKNAFIFTPILLQWSKSRARIFPLNKEKKIDRKSKCNGKELDIVENIWIPRTEISSWKPISDGVKIRTDFQTYSLSFLSHGRPPLFSISFHIVQYRAQHAAQHNLFICSEANISICYSTRHEIPLKSKQYFHGRFNSGCYRRGGWCNWWKESTGKIDLFSGCMCMMFVYMYSIDAFKIVTETCAASTIVISPPTTHNTYIDKIPWRLLSTVYMQSHSRHFSINWIE